jgi:hypothetical protein
VPLEFSSRGIPKLVIDSCWLGKESTNGYTTDVVDLDFRMNIEMCQQWQSIFDDQENTMGAANKHPPPPKARKDRRFMR